MGERGRGLGQVFRGRGGGKRWWGLERGRSVRR